MPIHTAENIIARFKFTHQRAPNRRGDPHTVFNKKLISQFIYTLIEKNSFMTLLQIQSEIWAKKEKLLNSPTPPSISWIHSVLHEKIYDGKKITLKIASLDPKKRNDLETLVQRHLFVQWYDKISELDKMRIVWVDEHGFNFHTVRNYARAIQGNRAEIKVPTVKGENISVVHGVSGSYGKIHIQVGEMLA